MISPNPITELAGRERRETVSGPRPATPARRFGHPRPAGGRIRRDGGRPRRDVGRAGHTHRRPGRTRARRDAQLRRHARLGPRLDRHGRRPDLRLPAGRGSRPAAARPAGSPRDHGLEGPRGRAFVHSSSASREQPHAARRPGRTRHGLHGRHRVRLRGRVANRRSGRLVGTLTLVGRSARDGLELRPPLRARLGDPPRARPRDELGQGPTSRSTAGRSATPSSRPSPTRSC